MKYDGNIRLAVPLGLLLAQAFRRYGLQADLLIPVPLHSERQQQRGFNHASLLAEVCSSSAKSVLSGRRILIIDDVSTTSATLEACATPLFEAGAKEIWGLVLKINS